ncbi:MAG: bifunctional pyr operon transcriptional regulator/uracil phosphoribosyltransferase PyrR [Chthoniobacterales bacterium]|jgi:pyrimidine operon attenuation protein/uracil phosphoribosyltransferase
MSRAETDQQVIDRAGLRAAVDRVAGEIVGELQGAGPVFLAGIPTRGVHLAARLATALDRQGFSCRPGAVDISMYRDDLGLREGVSPLQGTELPMDIDNWNVVLVDDVQHTGRTARAAIDAVLAFGRPRRILYAVLVDRGGRELPVRPDFTGLALTVVPGRRVRVRLAETDDGVEGVFES